MFRPDVVRAALDRLGSMSKPIQDMMAGTAGNVAGAIQGDAEPKPDDGKKTGERTEAITETGIETKDAASNNDTKNAMVKAQKKGSNA